MLTETPSHGLERTLQGTLLPILIPELLEPSHSSNTQTALWVPGTAVDAAERALCSRGGTSEAVGWPCTHTGLAVTPSGGRGGRPLRS